MKLKVNRTISPVLHKLTAMREYALITTKKRITGKDASDLISLISSDDVLVNRYIYIGNRAVSRDRFDKAECLRTIRARFLSLNEGDISFPDIRELYGLSEGKTLVINVEGEDLPDVNRKWICDYLRFSESERKYYLNDDFTSVKICLSRIAGRSVRHKGEDPVPVDITEYEIYDRIIEDLHKYDKEQAYGDGFNIEYSIVSDDCEHFYYLTHFFSNHCWNRDPQNLLNICFSAELLSGARSKESVRFTHPSKVTSRRSDGAEYLIEAIEMDNDNVRVKFRNSKTKEPSEGDVAGFRDYDNPVDLSMWIDLYYQEISMA